MDYDFIELKSYKLSDISDPGSLVIFVTKKHYLQLRPADKVSFQIKNETSEWKRYTKICV